VGIEQFRFLIAISRLRAKWAGVADKTDFIHGDFFKDLPKRADVLVTYLLPEMNAKILPILRKTYPSGTRLVSRDFRFLELEELERCEIGSTKLFLYRL